MNGYSLSLMKNQISITGVVEANEEKIYKWFYKCGIDRLIKVPETTTEYVKMFEKMVEDGLMERMNNTYELVNDSEYGTYNISTKTFFNYVLTDDGKMFVKMFIDKNDGI